MEEQNTRIVQEAYAAFQRADIPGVLSTLDDTVEWHAVIGTEGVVPTSGLRKGRSGVGQFFQQLADSIAFDSFEPREFIAQGEQVVVVGHYKGRAKATGRPWDADWVMIFTIRNGKIVRFREYTDTRQLTAAFQ
jgi:ketosteroid isomerase-like protein